MFTFFQSYQRFLFACIALLATVSVLFFGIASSDVAPLPSVPKTTRPALNGASISTQDCIDLARLLAGDARHFGAEGPHLSNPGVLQRDILETGIGELLATAYADTLRAPLQEKLDRIRAFHPYIHPLNRAICLEDLWARFHPSLASAFKALQNEEAVSSRTFSQLMALHRAAEQISPELFRHWLRYCETEMHTSPDASLRDRDLSIAGFHTLADWFSGRFLEIASEWILNAAIAAEAEGWTISLEEARSDLRHHFKTAWGQLTQEEKSFFSYEGEWQRLGLSEERAVQLWRRLLLAHAFLQTSAEELTADPFTEREIQAYSNEGRLIETYSWPAELSFRTMEDLVLFQTYLHAIALPPVLPLALPQTLRPLSEIETYHPELFHSSYQVHLARIPKAELSAQFGAKQRLLWQLEDAHWTALTARFTILPQTHDKTARIEALETLTPSLKKEVNLYSRALFLEEQQETLISLLIAAPSQETTLFVSPHSASLPDILNTKSFATLLERASQGDQEATHALLSYAGEDTLYAITHVERLAEPRLMTFQEVKETHALHKSLPRTEEETRALLKPLLLAMDDALHSQWSPGEGPFSFYATHRLWVPTHEELALRKQGQVPHALLTMQSNDTHCRRHEAPAFFTPPLDSWSDVDVSATGALTFTHIKAELPPLEEPAPTTTPLTRDATLHLAHTLLQRLQAQHVH